MEVASYKFFAVHQMPKEPKRKTCDYDIINRSGGYSLGQIQWYGAWRQYCFFPNEATVWNAGCLQDVLNFIHKLKTGVVQ